MHAISSYRGNRPTNKQTQPHTHRQDRLQYTVLQLASAQCNDSLIFVTLTNVYQCVCVSVLGVRCVQESLVNVTPSIAVNTNAENMIRAVNYSIIYDPLNGIIIDFRYFFTNIKNKMK